MPLILAIEPDKRQSSQLAAVVKGLQAELVQRPNAADGLAALHGRVPDLVLTSSLISPRDDSALAAHLRELGAAAAHVQTVTIPLLGSAAPKRAKLGMLASLRREKPQAPMTDGCDPDIFAEQVRQYLATAEEQKVTTATRLAVTPEAAEEETAVVEAIEEFTTPEPEPAVEMAAAYETPEPFEPIALSPVEAVAEPVEAAAIETEEALSEDLVADEPAGLPLSQLLQLVSDRAAAAAPIVSEPVATEAAVEETTSFEAMALEEFAEMAPVVEDVAPVVEPKPEPEPEPASDLNDLYVDPMAAQALEELSHLAPAQSLADGIPGEAPVPVVEMHAFQSLDSIANELAAGQGQRHESLDDLASLFAVAPSSMPSRPEPEHIAEPEVVPIEPIAQEFIAPLHGDKSLFASLFAEPATSRAAEPIQAPGIDPSLFASTPAEPIAAVEFAAPALPEPESILAALPDEVFATAAPEPVFAAPEPVVEAATEILLAEFEVPEPEPVLAAAPESELEPVFEDGPIAFEPITFEPAAEEPVAAVAASTIDDEISLDVDAFAFTAPEPPAAPAEPSRFSFTFVDGFGDALSDFEPSIAAMAADLGVGEQPPLDPYAARAAAPAVRTTINEPQAAPFLDEESLSLIGDAARKVSLDALVIEEFERGFQARRMKKAATKKKAHAGATQVTAPVVAERPAKPVKRPVQDEWGMFDPEQAGFAALEDEEGAEARPTTGTRVRVISY